MTAMDRTAYQAHAFHDSLPNGRASGELTVSEDGFEFHSGEHRVAAPLAGAKLTLGGAADRLVFLSHPQAPGWSIYTSDRTILAHPAVATSTALASDLNVVRRKRAQRVARFVIAIAVLVGAPLALIANPGSLTGLAARQIPPSWEEQLGKSAFAQYQIQSEMIEDEETRRLLTELTDALTNALPRSAHTFHFHIARDPALNAFALPGGYIVIHSELILRADNASELLGVLAHEIAHVTEQHGTRNLIASAGVVLTVQALIGDASGLLAAVASAAPFLLTQKYSRGFEREADEKGFELLQRAQIDPRGMATFFEKIKAEEEKTAQKVRERVGDAAGDVLTQTPEFLSTHPATDSRIDAMRKLIASQYGGYRNLDSTFIALKARIADYEQRNPREEEQHEDAN